MRHRESGRFVGGDAPAQALHDVQLPVAIAGPLRIGEHDHRVPLATTEHSLVVAVDRAAQAITDASGCRVTIVDDCHACERVLELATAREASVVAAWARTERDALGKAAATAAGRPVRAVIIDLEGRCLRVRVDVTVCERVCDPAASAAVDAIAALVDARAPARAIAPACWPWSALARTTRGRVVAAEVTLDATAVERWFGTCSRVIARARTTGQVMSRALAALFAACGQDLAALPVRFAEPDLEKTCDGSLRAKLVVSSVAVGTVGGDADRAPQRACLDIAGITSARELAELCAGVCLAAALAEAAACAASAPAEAVGWRERLSPRLAEVLDLLLTGLSEKEIAHRVGLSAATTHQYVVQVYRAANVSSRAQLMASAMRPR